MVEQVGERKYMMEEDFRRTANYLKAVISPGEKLWKQTRTDHLHFLEKKAELILFFKTNVNEFNVTVSFLELGTPQEESNRISREIDEKLGKVASNFQNSGIKCLK